MKKQKKFKNPFKNITFSDDVSSPLADALPGSSVVTITSEPEIKVEANIVIDATEAGNLKKANEAVTIDLEEQGFAVEDISVDLLTAGPTTSPTLLTSIPTARPSMTGIIVTLELTQKGGSLTTIELKELEEEIAINYGVSIDEVQLDVEYELREV